MFGLKTMTPTSSNSASGIVVSACFGGVMSTVRTVSLTQATSASASPATTALRSAPFVSGFDRLIARFVATVFLPELFLQDGIRLVHRRFAKLSGYDVVVLRL